jgi:hypothetical protein
MAHLDKKIDPLTCRLTTLKEAHNPNPHLDEGGYNFLWGEPEYDHRSEDNTPEQNQMLQMQREIAERHQGQYHYDANNQIVPGPPPLDKEFDEEYEQYTRNMTHINDNEIMSEAGEPVSKHFGPELLAAGQAAIAQNDAARAAHHCPFAPSIIQLGSRNPPTTGPG